MTSAEEVGWQPFAAAGFGVVSPLASANGVPAGMAAPVPPKRNTFTRLRPPGSSSETPSVINATAAITTTPITAPTPRSGVSSENPLPLRMPPFV